MSSENLVSYFGVKRQFDPASSEDLQEYRHFLETGQWANACPFICESPYTSVTFMIERKIATYWIDSLIETTE